MNNLEQLKALIAEEKKWRREWINAEIASDDREDLWSLRQEYYSAKRNRSALSDELLPQLVAVAEAAAEIMGDYNLDVVAKPIGMPLVCNNVVLTKLAIAVKNLTKDTDK